MNKDFFRKVIAVPAIMAIVLGIALFIFFKVNIENFIPLYNDTQYAYHDTLVDDIEFKEDKNASVDSFKKNQCIGLIRAGEGYPIRYDMDYSNIITSVSFVKGSAKFGDMGFTYLYAGNNNAKAISKDNSFVISSIFGEKTYKFKSKQSFDSEYKTLNYTPDCESAVIIYYHDSATAGFTSKYIAMVYEEVK